MWLYGEEPLKVSHHSAKFGGHMHCGNGDIMVLVDHVISRKTTWSKGHVLLWLRARRDKSLTLPSLVATGTVVVDILTFLQIR